MAAEQIHENEGQEEITRLIGASRDYAKVSKIDCNVMKSALFIIVWNKLGGSTNGKNLYHNTNGHLVISAL
jgi:hypothetical protein